MSTDKQNYTRNNIVLTDIVFTSNLYNQIVIDAHIHDMRKHVLTNLEMIQHIN